MYTTRRGEGRLERGHGRRGGGLDDDGDGVLLAAHLQHLAVGVGVQVAHERGAARRPVLREEPPRLEADAAGVAQRLGALRPRTPLGRLLDAAVAAPPVALGGRGGGAARQLRREMALWLAPALLGLVLGLLALVLGAWRFVEEVEGGGVH